MPISKKPNCEMGQKQPFQIDRIGPQLVCLGSPMIDITVKVDEAFLKKFNLEIDNAYVACDENKRIFGEIIELDPLIQVGGSVTNTVRIFNKLVDEENSVMYIGSVGEDKFAETIEKLLEMEKIDCYFPKISKEKTATAAVLLWQKGRTLITDLGASKYFSLEHLKDKMIWNKLQSSKIIYFSGFFIRVSFDVIKKIIEETNSTIAINLGAPFLSTVHRKELIYIYKNAHLIFGNEAEHRAFGKSSNISSEDLKDVILKSSQICKNRTRIVVVTRGDKSVMVMHDDEIEEIDVNILEDSQVVDTNGAGDAFVGGFLSSYVRNHDISTCVLRGVWAAQKIIQKLGFSCDFQDDFFHL